MNRKFPVGSWILRYYPPAAQHRLGSPWIRPNQVVRQGTDHTVGIQRGPEKPIVVVHVDDLKLCPAPRDISWNPGTSTSKSFCASTVAFRPGSHISDTSTPSVDVSDWDDVNTHHSALNILKELDSPIDLNGHILSPFYIRDLNYQDSRFHCPFNVLQTCGGCWTENFCNRHKEMVETLDGFPHTQIQDN